MVPPQFLEKTQQELNKFIPVVVPMQNDHSVAASVNHETLSIGSEPVPEVAAEVPAPEDPVTPVVASEVVEESLPSAAVEEEAPQSETEITTDASPVVEEAQEVRAEETTEPQPSVVDEIVPEEVQPEVVEPEAVQPEIVEPEVVTDAAPQQEEVILPETTLSVDETPSEVLANEVTAQEIPKPEETPKSDPSSGKSINSAVHAVPSTTLITHFGYNPNAIVRNQISPIAQQGTIVDPRTLVPVEFRHFIYENDAPEVVAAKVAFFRVQAALTPRKL